MLGRQAALLYQQAALFEWLTQPYACEWLGTCTTSHGVGTQGHWSESHRQRGIHGVREEGALIKPLGQSRDSTTLRNPVVSELSPALRLALSLRNAPSIHLLLSWDWGSDKEKQRYSVARVGTPASPLTGFQDRAGKEADFWEQKCLGGAYSK